MLKTLAILAVLVVGLGGWAWSQIPRNGGQQEQPPQDKHNKTPTLAAPCLCNVQTQNAPPKDAEPAKQKPSNYPWRELYAPANVPNWFLFAAAAWAGWMALRTLEAISQQVGTFISKERARLTVELGPFEFAESGKMQTVNLIVANRGSTNAFISSAKCCVYVKSAEWDMKDALLDHQMRLPKVIVPNPKGEEVFEWVDSGKRPIRDFDQETFEALRCYRVGVYAIGYIEFWDVFDNHWRLNFCRKWGAWYSMGDWLSVGDWPDYGPPDANGECKIEKPKRRWFSLGWAMKQKAR